ncbi:MAG: hypothetical protein ACHQUC_03260 [Chlamydiales bacterium]
MQEQEHEHPFYGTDIFKDQQKKTIQNLLEKYRHEPVNEELLRKIWDELQMEKHKGNIIIPFKVVMRRDSYKKFPDYVEIILDTKV